MTTHGPRGRHPATRHHLRRHFLGLAAGAAGTGLLRPPALLAQSRPPLLPPIAEVDALVAFGHTGPVTDGGWTAAHDQGVQAVRAAFPRLRTVYVESIPYSADATRIFRQFVAEGAQMVIATSDYGDFIRDVSDRAPGVAFMECDGHNVTGNLGWYYLTHWYASYVIGIAAGLMTRTNRLGFVGSFPIPSVYAGANAVLLGARSVNPAATLQAISINAWFDPQAATQAGTALVENGCDFLCGIMDDPGYLRVAQQRGIKAAMWNTDMRQYGPDAYISSVMLDFRAYYVEQVRARLAGTWQPQGHFLTLGQGVDRDAWGRTVPPAVAAQADAMRARIMAGYNPFRGPIRDAAGRLRVPAGTVMDDALIYQWDWSVEGVSGLD
ncbi:basic membrane lipoprotein [Gluconacetobacter diazotrophicus PA1 5]|uniref:BMP family ABC transporter substrate-binding protein n=2 Tax=Gluconacetobacter diazotrophicus TaxID=33996 RepID=A0A7W4FCU9_GLUDI|nr:BMP family ABC transporter substrate-binding protein [Gluconacetobacter diazotrophicus]ACI52882.1 basic membrane lipoprotein [Gluconacetobacter diazotrophicus PA1 5]MBB2155379.1 BMP family ABC transporter substrate-binding protein [Gluconacetobacter diazotrophicus]TWB08973.1 nucleoside-binding protein [Gluconacetobacter diazotrophicus]CAP57152.1 putative lipoprotein [Gluconacetobacter diazotrophicus PA1 5]